MPDNSIAHIIMENILYFDNFTLLLDVKSYFRVNGFE